MRPSFPLEHLEHRDLIGTQRIALDLLQSHRGKAALAGLRNVGRREAGRFSHGGNIAQNLSKITRYGPGGVRPLFHLPQRLSRRLVRRSPEGEGGSPKAKTDGEVGPRSEPGEEYYQYEHLSFYSMTRLPKSFLAYHSADYKRALNDRLSGQPRLFAYG